MPTTLKAETLRALAEKATPELLSVSPRVMGNMLRLGGEHQRPRARDWESANYDADGLLVAELLHAVPEIMVLLEADKDERVAALEAENGRMREALRGLIDAIDAPRYGDDSIRDDLDGFGARPGPLNIARRALGKDQAS